MWHKVRADPRARLHGGLSRPARLRRLLQAEGAADHSNYSKRAVALDMVEVMDALRPRHFHVVGHDRGGRVAHRLARDHGRRVKTLTVLDISPTLKMYESTNFQFARAYYHWFFLIQEAPIPSACWPPRPFYIFKRLGRGKSGLKHFDKAAMAAYVRAFKDRAPSTHLRGLTAPPPPSTSSTTSRTSSRRSPCPSSPSGAARA